MKEFDVKKLIDNIYEVAKRQGKKMGDLEEAVHVSQGYFSRLKGKDEKASAPSVELVAAVASELNTTVDALLTCDYGVTSEADKYVLEFLDKLITDSKNFDVVWDMDTEDAIANIILQDPERVAHPLFRSMFDADHGVVAYDSAFHPYESDEKIKAIAPFFHTKINGGKYELYLSRIFYKDVWEEGDYEYELYMIERVNMASALSNAFSGEKPKKPVCHSMWNIPNEVGSHLKTLYAAAGETVTHVKLDNVVKSAISVFMGKENQ